MTPEDKSKSSEPRGFGPDEFSVFMPSHARRPGLGARQILFIGVAGACVLGVGLGLWAKPAMSERQAMAAKPADAPKAAPPPPARQLEIVVDDRPAPLGKPIDVLPSRGAPPSAPLVPQPPIPQNRALPWPDAAPTAPPEGLIKTRVVAPEPPRAPRAAPPAAERPKADRPRLAPLVVAALVPPKPAPPKAVPQKTVATKAVAPKAIVKSQPLAPVRLAKDQPDPKAHRLELARATTARAEAHRLELAETANAAKTARAAARHQQIELARAEARGRAEARAEAKAQALAYARDDARKRARLVALAHAVQRLLPHQARTAPSEQARVEQARVERPHARKARHEPQVERASLKTRRAQRFAEPPPRAHAPVVPPAHASGLMKVSAPRCASRDAGQAIVCADPALGAAERQLNRAYQDARAAGVPDAQLQHQQQRWLAARSAAAREAPWAVHDVYIARIAELNGQAREAHGPGY
jgi:colicin import membrane protein